MGLTSVLALGVFYIGFVASQTVEDNCPKEVAYKDYLKIFGDSCFYFDVFRLKKYSEAKEECHTLGGTLAMPKTEELTGFLVNTLMYGLPEIYYEPVWIGLNDLEHEDVYVWEDGSPVVWSNFEGSIGGFGGGGEDCIALDPVDGFWHDYTCDTFGLLRTSNPHKGFVCQFKSGGSVDGDDQDFVSTTASGGDVGVSTTASSGEEGDDENDQADVSTTASGGDVQFSTTASTSEDGGSENDQDDVSTTPSVADVEISTTASSGEEGDDVTTTPSGADVGETTTTEATAPEENPGNEDGDGCPQFFCSGLDCGMDGYQKDENNCSICACNT